MPQRLQARALWWIWGGALPTILDAIVDALPEGGGGNEPYIVQGAAQSSITTTALSVPAQEYARAKEAFLAGRVVLVPEETYGLAYIVTAYSPNAAEDLDENPIEGLCFPNYSMSINTVNALISQ